MKVATMCSGIGSPEQALKELAVDHENVFACEKDKFARQTYLANFAPGIMYNDMTIEKWDLPEQYADLIVAGIPCQSFSLAGKRQGENDPRGLLIYDFIRYVKAQRPKVFIIENVKGLLSSKSDITLSNILLSLLYKFSEIDKWERLNIQKDRLTLLGQIVQSYLLTLFHHKQEFQLHQYTTLLELNSNLTYELWDLKVRDGLNKRLKFLEEKICLITKKQNYLQTEPIVPLGCNEEGLGLNQPKLFSIENLKAVVTNILEKTVGINANIGLFAKSDLGENSKKEKLYTILMQLNSTMNNQTYMYVLEMNIIRLTILALDLSLNLCKEIWLISTLKKEFTGLKTFDIWLAHLSILGYNLHYRVLNCKHYGLPQNRERVFIIGIRPDLDDCSFSWPKKVPLKLRLIDMLETVVDEKYYLSDTALKYIVNDSGNWSDRLSFMNFSDAVVSGSITTNHSKGVPYNMPSVAMRGRNPDNPKSRKSGEQTEQMIEVNENPGISNVISSVQKDNLIIEQRVVGFKESENAIRGVRKDGTGISEHFYNKENGISGSVTSSHKPKVIQLNPSKESGQQNRVYDSEGISPAIDGKAGIYDVTDNNYRIRRYTPLECMRLMGFPDNFIKPCSETQTYKQAGNGIPVHMMKTILKQLLPILI